MLFRSSVPQFGFGICNLEVEKAVTQFSSAINGWKGVEVTNIKSKSYLGIIHDETEEAYRLIKSCLSQKELQYQVQMAQTIIRGVAKEQKSIATRQKDALTKSFWDDILQLTDNLHEDRFEEILSVSNILVYDQVPDDADTTSTTKKIHSTKDKSEFEIEKLRKQLEFLKRDLAKVASGKGSRPTSRSPPPMPSALNAQSAATSSAKPSTTSQDKEGYRCGFCKSNGHEFSECRSYEKAREEHLRSRQNARQQSRGRSQIGRAHV